MESFVRGIPLENSRALENMHDASFARDGAFFNRDTVFHYAVARGRRNFSRKSIIANISRDRHALMDIKFRTRHRVRAQILTR